MAIPQEEIDRIAERADIVDVVGDYVRLEQKGSRFWGLSPFKSEKTPSFCVDNDKGMYYCFSTHQGGNIFTFLMNIEHLSFPEAVEAIAKRYAIEYRHGYATDGGQQSGDRKALLELYERITDSFHYLLTHSDEAQAAQRYLQSRAIEPQTIVDFRLGYCPQKRNWLWNFLLHKGYSADLLQRSGLFRARYREQALFAGRIIFPITNRKDEVVAFGARSHTGSEPKYINSPETLLFKKRNELFGKVRAIMRNAASVDSNEIYLVEGYMDVLALYQLGITNVVAALGTAFSAEQARALGRMAKTIILLFDSDDAGTNATLRAARILQQMDIEPQVCQLPQALDPAEMMRTDDNFRKNCRNVLAQHTEHVLQFLLRVEFPQKQVHSTAQSDSALKRVFEYTSLVSTVVRRELYMQQVADYLNIDRNAVLQDFQQWSRTRSPSGVARADTVPPRMRERQPSRAAESSRFEIECMIMSICCPNEFQYLRAIVDSRCFENKTARYLFELQERAFQDGVSDSGKIVDMIEHDKLKDYTIRKMIAFDAADCGQAITDIAHRLKKRYLVRNRAQQIALLRTLEQDASLDNKNVEDVQLEIMYLNKEILKQ